MRIYDLTKFLQEYYENIVPQLFAVLAEKDLSPVQLRAVAFTLSRLISSEQTSVNKSAATRLVLSTVHRPFLSGLPASSNLDGNQSPSAALATLQAILVNSDPSPTLISSLLTPIIPALFLISSEADSMKFVDPSLRACLQGLLGTWGRVISAQEGIATLWLTVEGEGGIWNVDISGEINQSDRQYGDYFAFRFVF